jgi:Rrf2 family protein
MNNITRAPLGTEAGGFDGAGTASIEGGSFFPPCLRLWRAQEIGGLFPPRGKERKMRLSAKARYGLSALISMASSVGCAECVTVVSLAKKLDISKIYLEQVFALIKRAGIVTSIKGSQGGYQLAKPAKDISVYDILSSIETSLFENTEFTHEELSDAIIQTMKSMVYDLMDQSLCEALSKVTLQDLANKAAELSQNYMYYL